MSSTGRRGVVLAAIGVAVFGAVFACTNDAPVVTFGSGVTDEGAVFAAPDAAEASSGAGADADASGARCISTECPAPWATCAALDGTLPPYACGTDLGSDVANCGACGHACRPASSAYHVHMRCSSGQCQAFCTEDHADCNGIPDDGCESSTLDDPANCGSCGVTCAPGVACKNGKCGCPPGTTECGDRCVDLASDDANCGACGFACLDHPPADAGALRPHTYFGCAEGQCKDLRCVQNGAEFWADCNGSLDPDGCEVDLRSDLGNCGSCGKTCAPGKQCFSINGLTDCQCQQGQTLCAAQPPLGSAYCTDLESDPRNCGACGYVCPYLPNGKSICVQGRCKAECTPQTADCNGRDDDGCEVDLNKDPRNCGACGVACDVARGQPCVGGRCVTRDCQDPVTK